MSTSINPGADFSAELVRAVAQVWAAIRANHADVPDVVITVGAGAETRGLKLGHFAAGAWQHEESEVSELFIGGEGLARGPEEVLATLLHEAAHGIAHTREIKDTSRQGRWHNTKFRDIAEALGLTVTKDSRIGWSVSALAEGTADTYADEVARLAGVLTAHRRTRWTTITLGGGKNGGQGGTEGDDTEEDKPKSNNGISAVCGCDRKVRVSHSTYDAGPIICGLCGTAFTDPDAEDNDTDDTDENNTAHD